MKKIVILILILWLIIGLGLYLSSNKNSQNNQDIINNSKWDLWKGMPWT